MLDFLEIVTKLSKAFQSDKVTVTSAFSALERADIALSALSQRPGIHQEDFRTSFPSNKFKGEDICNINQKDQISTQQKQLVNLSRNECFSSLKTNKIVVAARELLDIRSWPTDKEQIAVFGEEHTDTPF